MDATQRVNTSIMPNSSKMTAKNFVGAPINTRPVQPNIKYVNLFKNLSAEDRNINLLKYPPIPTNYH